MARSFEEKIRQLRASLTEVLLRLEAAIDFDDQGIQLNDFNPQWAKFVDKLSDFCRVVVAQAEFLREPLVMLAGMPNVGKSSLINLLAGRDVSIVNETAGTTRDLVTARLKLGQLQVSVVDTAGIRSDADSEIEAQGIGRAVGLSKTALVIWVADATRLHQTLQALHSGPVGNISGVLINKADLVDVGEIKDLGHPWRLVSAKMDSGHTLSEGISEWISARLEGFSVPDQTWKISILSEALDIAREAGQSSAAQDGLWDLVVSDIRRVERRLADLVGPIDRQDLLNEIFMRMCIGK